MKRNVFIYIGILLLLLATVTAWRMRPEPVEGSELYQRYKDLPGVRVGFIKDFPLNDTLTCDVTTFEALTDEGWQWMLDSLGLQRTSVLDSIGRSEAWPGEISDNCNFASLYYRWMAVFHTTTTEGRSAVIDYYFDYQVKYPMTMIPTKDNTINL